MALHHVTLQGPVQIKLEPILDDFFQRERLDHPDVLGSLLSDRIGPGVQNCRVAPPARNPTLQDTPPRNDGQEREGHQGELPDGPTGRETHDNAADHYAAVLG